MTPISSSLPRSGSTWVRLAPVRAAGRQRYSPEANRGSAGVRDAKRAAGVRAQGDVGHVEERREFSRARPRHVDRDEGADLVDHLQRAGARRMWGDEEPDEVQIRIEAHRN